MDVVERLKTLKSMSYISTFIWFLLACFSNDLLFSMISVFSISVSFFIVFVALTSIWSIFWAFFLKGSKNKLITFFEYFGIYIISFIVFVGVLFFFVDCLFLVNYSSYNLVVVILGLQNIGLIYCILCMRSNIKEIRNIILGVTFNNIINENESFQNMSKKM